MSILLFFREQGKVPKSKAIRCHVDNDKFRGCLNDNRDDIEEAFYCFFDGYVQIHLDEEKEEEEGEGKCAWRD